MVFGFMFGVVGGSIVSLAVRGDDGVSVPLVVFAGAVGAVVLGFSPVKARSGVTPEISIPPGEPVPLGSLARTFLKELEPMRTRGLQWAVIVGFGAPLAALALYAAADAPPSPFVLAGVAVVGYVAAVACLMVLPLFLLDERTRRAFAVLSWAGAREFERVFGSKRAAVGFPTTPEEARRWLTEKPNRDALQLPDIELMVLAGDLDAARQAVERLPVATPLERYVKAAYEALVRYERTGDTDRSAVRAALAAIPAGREHSEAAASAAVDDARLLLPDGDFRAPLLAVRGLIPRATRESSSATTGGDSSRSCSSSTGTWASSW